MNSGAARTSRTHAFVAPELDGPPTGGTLYNARLIAALRASGVRCTHTLLADARSLAGSDAQSVWVDSLYLDALPALRAHTGTRRLCLIAHYLPSLVAHARELDWADLSANEQAAITAADGFLVTSEFMRGQFARFSRGEGPVLCVEPGSDVAPLPSEESARPARVAIQGLMLCNVVEAKGVLALLQALAREARPGDRFALQIAGRLDLQPEYAQACRQAIAASDALRERVTLCGALPHAEALARLERCDVLLSASRMESYGMALAEARAAGVPIIARAGGHAQALVSANAGGLLVADEAAVSARFLELARNPTLVDGLRGAAVRNAHTRSWSQAAADFVAGLALFEA